MSLERRERKQPSHLIPKVFSHLNKEAIEALRQEVNLSDEQEAVEKRCQARQELCLRLQEIDSNNPTWRYGKEFFSLFPRGPEAIWQLFKSWDVFQKSDGTLTPPSELKNAYPREFLDLEPRMVASLINQHEFKTGQALADDFKNELSLGAEEARRASLEGYHVLKSGLLKFPIPRVSEAPLLARDFIQTLINATKEFPEIPVCIIGLSADEAYSYNVLMQKGAKGTGTSPLVGLDTEFSPALGRLIKERKEGKKDQSEVEKIYLTKADIREGIPLKDNSVILGMLYVLHHVPPAEQKQVIQQMIRVSAKTKEGTPGVALHIFEPLNSQPLLRMVVETNCYLGNETTLFDAGVGTHICGGQTTESILKLAKEIDSSVSWDAQVYPNVPPVDFFQKKILPAQQVGLKGY